MLGWYYVVGWCWCEFLSRWDLTRLTSCSWFLCAEVDVLVEFPGHNSEIPALEVWLSGWHLIKVGMSRCKMVQEDVGMLVWAMSTALVKSAPTAFLFQKFVGSAIFQHLDLDMWFWWWFHELQQLCHGETRKSSGIPDSLIFHVLPMVAEDILPLIEGDDDSLDTLMLGFE